MPFQLNKKQRGNEAGKTLLCASAWLNKEFTSWKGREMAGHPGDDSKDNLESLKI